MGVLRPSIAARPLGLTLTMAVPCGALTAFWPLVQQKSMPQSSIRSSAAARPDTESTRYRMWGNSFWSIRPMASTGLVVPRLVSTCTTATILMSGSFFNSARI